MLIIAVLIGHLPSDLSKYYKTRRLNNWCKQWENREKTCLLTLLLMTSHIDNLTRLQRNAQQTIRVNKIIQQVAGCQTRPVEKSVIFLFQQEAPRNRTERFHSILIKPIEQIKINATRQAQDIYEENCKILLKCPQTRSGNLSILPKLCTFNQAPIKNPNQRHPMKYSMCCQTGIAGNSEQLFSVSMSHEKIGMCLYQEIFC